MENITPPREAESAAHTDRIRSGTKVRLPDGTMATVYPDVGIGRPFDGHYRTFQRNPVTGGTRVDCGWTRDQLTVLDVSLDQVRS